MNELNTEVQVPVQAPAFIKISNIMRGTENVGADDIAIPRLEIIQALSPARNPRKAEYIEGIQEGDIYNSLTRMNYGESINIIPVLYRMSYLVWGDIDNGGGFYGSYQSREEAVIALQKAEADDPKMAGLINIQDTPEFFLLIILQDGTMQEATISLPKSKQKVAKDMNALIRMNKRDSFANVFTLKSIEDENNSGKLFFNFSVSWNGWVNEEQYAAAENMYETVKTKAKEVDYSDLKDYSKATEAEQQQSTND